VQAPSPWPSLLLLLDVRLTSAGAIPSEPAASGPYTLELGPVEVIRGSATTVTLPQKLPASFRLEVRGLPPGVTAAAGGEASITLRASDDARLAPSDATVAVLDEGGGVRSLRAWNVDVRLPPGQLDPDFATNGQLVDPKTAPGASHRFPRGILPFPSGAFLLSTQDYVTSSLPAIVTLRSESGAKLAAFDRILFLLGLQAPLNRAVVSTFDHDLAAIPEVGPLDQSAFQALPQLPDFYNYKSTAIGPDGTVYRLYRYNPEAEGVRPKTAIFAVNVNGTLKSTFGTNGQLVFDSGADNSRDSGLLALSDGSLLMYLGSQFPNSGYDPDPNQRIRRISDTGEVGAEGTLNSNVYARTVALDGSGRLLVVGNREAPRGAAAVVRATADGNLDATFGDRGLVILPRVREGAEYMCATVAYSQGLVVGRGNVEGRGSAKDVCHYDRLDSGGQLDKAFVVSSPPSAAASGGDAVLVKGRRMLLMGVDSTSGNTILQRHFL
jgi:hypothetical protein